MKRALVLALLLGLTGCYGKLHKKHTQQCQLMFVASDGKTFWFMRPNHEIFSMNFDNPPAFQSDLKFRDITYFDDSADQVHFVKAQLY